MGILKRKKTYGPSAAPLVVHLSFFHFDWVNFIDSFRVRPGAGIREPDGLPSQSSALDFDAGAQLPPRSRALGCGGPNT
ncbi:protein of unknown function [Methylocaldum szegediense]|uniref:Transposase n=1 Tax=Methylocaldum szegediense TaxID=73780 RepID=A0ABN8XEG9_9GAMM|nr:protein of unknown function [Methylocaldum szegediense]